MGNLISSLLATGGAIKAYDRTLDVVQSNISNASTPGYAAARLRLVSMPFDPAAGLPGGVRPGAVESSRNDFVEQSVWAQQSATGEFTQKSESMGPIEYVLGVTAEAALPTHLNQFFQSFSQLATAPNDSVQRRQVLDNAGELAASFNDASRALAAASSQGDLKIRNTVDQINQIVGRVLEYNRAVSAGAVSHQDTASDAAAYAALEELAQLVDFKAERNASGLFDIRLGSGQSALLLGTRQCLLQANPSPAQTGIQNDNGETVTAQFQSGRLAALLDTRNILVAALSADLDRLAKEVAVQVNTTLNNGVDANGEAGQDLFSFTAAHPAATLAVVMSETTALAAADADAPGGSGNASNLAALAGQPLLDGATFSQFYGSMAARVGRQKSSADQDRQLHEQLLIQAQAVREQTSGVSLDEEATRLIQFQRAYQASAQMFTVLSQLTGTIINMLQP
jgi:flagellar hook-associated protein 1 FlgK